MLTATMLLFGFVLVAMALLEAPVRRLPLSAALIYLAVGWIAAELNAPLPRPDPLRQAPLLELLLEWAVLISLFGVGLKLKLPARWARWRVALLLASSTMVLTVALATLAAAWLLGLPWAAALLLAAILAPTDPVLASEVQIHDADDRDAVRLSLTAEGGLNDGTAFPLVTLALGLLGLHELGTLGGTWALRDLLWAVGGGLGVGWLCGRAVGHAVALRLEQQHPVCWDELLYLGTIALAYALSDLLHVTAFLAVFAAGVALLHGHREPPHEGDALGQRLSAFSGRLERLVEVSMVLFTGAAMTLVRWSWPVVAYALLLVFVLRPLAVVLTIRGLSDAQRRLVAWFGIRGVGSLFYVAYALQHGVQGLLAQTLISATLVAVALSIVLHGISATPLMRWYHHWRRRTGRGRVA
jgi:NhaP-type Na+/H+ or K+/H+ antiporter